MAEAKAKTSITDQPFYWFALLEQAVDAGDFAKAAEAQRELVKRGVQVVYTPHRRQRKAEVAHAG